MSPDKEWFRIQSEFCAAMAHPVRLEIIDLLKDGGRTVNEIAAVVGISQSNLSQHLSVLRHRGVVHAERQGNGVRYSLTNRKIVDACRLIRGILTKQIRRQGTILRR